jgi:hypothetical protein
VSLFSSEDSNEGQQYDSVIIGSGESLLSIDSGRTYFVFGERPDKAMWILRHIARDGRPVLCISRLHPDLLDRECSALMTQGYWLSERPGANALPPDQLSRIVQTVAEFARTNSRAILVLDGLEYISLFNGFAKVNMFVEQLNDLAMEAAAVLLIPVDPRLFDSRSMARLRRYAEVVA